MFSLGSEPRWVLFPRIIVVQEERDEVVFPGIALRDWQGRGVRPGIEGRYRRQKDRTWQSKEGEKGDNEWNWQRPHKPG